MLEDATAQNLSATATLERLLRIEVDDTEARRLAGRLRFASLPTPASLENFDVDAASGIDRPLLDELGTCRYLETATNVLLIGTPGTGKTHLATGLARAAAHAGYRTYFTTAADLPARCHRAAIEGRWATTMRFYAGPALLVIDELGYLPLPAEAASALFQRAQMGNFGERSHSGVEPQRFSNIFSPRMPDNAAPRRVTKSSCDRFPRMPTPALDALETALSDVDRLLAHHPKAAGGGRGRPSSDEGPLLRSSLVLIYAAWEVYVEDSAVWAVEEVTRDIADVANLPQSIKDFVAKRKETDPWDLAGDGWRTKTCELARLLVYGDPARSQFGINTAGPGQVVDLHSRLLGADLLGQCRWQKMSAASIKKNLSDFISVRGEIAHKGTTPGALHLKGAQSWRNFVWRLAQALDNKIEGWVSDAVS